MAVVNDIPGAYERIRAEADRRAAQLGIQREVLYGFFNDKAHFPMSIAELEEWGNTPDRIYGIRRRTPDGVWHPITQGMQTPGKTDQDRAGFMGAGGQTGHMINNAEDSDIQRFQDWHPEILDAPGPSAIPNAAGPRTGATASNGQGAVARSQEVDVNSPAYQQANPSGQPFGSAPPAGSGAGAPGPGSAGPGASPPPSGGTGPANGVGFNEGAAQAANAAVLAWLAKRRLEELEIPELRLKTETELAAMRRADALAVWKQAYETATLTGNFQGAPTLDATKTTADISGYTGGAGTAGNGQKVLDAIASLRTDPTYLAQDGNGRRQMEAARVVQATGGTLSQAQALQAIEQMRATTAAGGGFGGAPSTPQQIEGILGQIAPGTPTLGRERDIGRLELDRIIEENRKAEEAKKFGLDTQKEQDTTLVSVLNLLSNLRGPENAFAYANTLANVPESVRQNIATAMARLPVAPRNPAAAGVWNDVQAQTQQGLPPRVTPQPGAPAPTGPALPEPSVPMPGGMTAIGQPVLTQNPGLGGSGSPLPPGAQLQNEMNRFPAGAGPTYGPRTAPGLDATAGGTPPGFFPSMTNTTPLAPTPAPTAIGQPVMVSGAPLMSQDPRAPAPMPAYGPRTTPQPIRPAVAAGMTLPGQISPTDWNRTTEYNRQLLLAGYENAGEDKANVLDEYTRSLPKAYGPRTGRLRAA